MLVLLFVIALMIFYIVYSSISIGHYASSPIKLKLIASGLISIALGGGLFLIYNLIIYIETQGNIRLANYILYGIFVLAGIALIFINYSKAENAKSLVGQVVLTLILTIGILEIVNNFMKYITLENKISIFTLVSISFINIHKNVVIYQSRVRSSLNEESSDS